MSKYHRAFSHGTIMVIVGCVIAFLLVLAQQYDLARSMAIITPLLGSLVAALVAPRRRFIVGISLLPVICVAVFGLLIAWNSVVPLLAGEGIAGAVRDIRGMSPAWVGASIIGAALGWAIK